MLRIVFLLLPLLPLDDVQGSRQGRVGVYFQLCFRALDHSQWQKYTSVAQSANEIQSKKYLIMSTSPMYILTNFQEDLAIRIAKKLHHHLKEVKKAAKKAKTFETHRLVKKLKGFRSRDGQAEEISVLESELELLKVLFLIHTTEQ